MQFSSAIHYYSMMTDLLYSRRSAPSASTEMDSVVPALLLTPENCESSSRIRAFLHLSRIATDDTIRQHLNEVNLRDCDSYFSRKIVPQWRARADAIAYCSNYAKKLREDTESSISGEKNYDLRVNPYALKDEKDRLDRQYATCTTVENWVRNEEIVEKIIHEQTTGILNDRCYYKDWLAEFRALLK